MPHDLLRISGLSLAHSKSSVKRRSMWPRRTSCGQKRGCRRKAAFACTRTGDIGRTQGRVPTAQGQPKVHVKLLGVHIRELGAQLGGGLGVNNGKGRLRGMFNAEADQNAREQTHEQREHWARAGPSGRLWRGRRDRPGARPPRLSRGLEMAIEPNAEIIPPSRRRGPALPQPPPSDAAALLTAIEKAALNPQVDIGKVEQLLALYERIEGRRAEAAFNESLTAAQAAMRPVATDMENSQTKSRYASYAALDRVLRPIYMAEVRNEVEVAARTLGLQLQLLPAASPDDFVSAFEAMVRERADALIVMASPMLFDEYRRT